MKEKRIIQYDLKHFTVLKELTSFLSALNIITVLKVVMILHHVLMALLDGVIHLTTILQMDVQTVILVPTLLNPLLENALFAQQAMFA